VVHAVGLMTHDPRSVSHRLVLRLARTDRSVWVIRPQHAPLARACQGRVDRLGRAGAALAGYCGTTTPAFVGVTSPKPRSRRRYGLPCRDKRRTDKCRVSGFGTSGRRSSGSGSGTVGGDPGKRQLRRRLRRPRQGDLGRVLVAGRGRGRARGRGGRARGGGLGGSGVMDSFGRRLGDVRPGVGPAALTLCRWP